MAKAKLVVVLWDDHYSSDDWITEDEEREDLTKPALMHSVGWIAKETEDSLLLVATVCEADGHSKQHFRIAKKCIVKRRTIRQPKDW
jgi:hypothetical protein